MIMRQHHMFNRLVGDGAHPLDHLAGHRRRRLGVEHEAAVVADDHSGIGIALGGEGIEIGADFGEGDFLLHHVRGGCETLGNHRFNSLYTRFYTRYYCCCCCCCWSAASIRRCASAIASRSTSRSPIWLARIRTSAASRSALCSSFNPRWASTTARNASSGLAKFELVDNAILEPQLMPAARASAASSADRVGRRKRAAT